MGIGDMFKASEYKQTIEAQKAEIARLNGMLTDEHGQAIDIKWHLEDLKQK